MGQCGLSKTVGLEGPVLFRLLSTVGSVYGLLRDFISNVALFQYKFS